MSVGRYWDAESASSDFAEFTSPKYYWLSGMPNGTDSYERTGTEVAYHTLEYRILIGIAAAITRTNKIARITPTIDPSLRLSFWSSVKKTNKKKYKVEFFVAANITYGNKKTQNSNSNKTVLIHQKSV